MNKSALAPRQVGVLVGRPKGPDPTAHYWFEQEGRWRRLCDGDPWADSPDPDHPMTLACYHCQTLYLDDLVYGHGLLTITSPPNAGETTSGGALMPNATMVRFARFCEADAVKRPDIAYGSGGWDYHRPLKVQLRNSHWITNDVGIFERVLAGAPFSKLKDASQVKALNSSARNYLEFWHTLEGASVMPAPRVTVDFHGLNIAVDPEVVVSVGATDARVLKLSFVKAPPTAISIQVFCHLMELAGQQSQEWKPSWVRGIWDIQRQSVIVCEELPEETRTSFKDMASDFIRLWEQGKAKKAAGSM